MSNGSMPNATIRAISKIRMSKQLAANIQLIDNQYTKTINLLQTIFFIVSDSPILTYATDHQGICHHRLCSTKTIKQRTIHPLIYFRTLNNRCFVRDWGLTVFHFVVLDTIV